MTVSELLGAVNRKKWVLIGLDTFDGEFYPFSEHDTELECNAAATERLKELEKRQPSSSSGGQSGIQDRVFILEPGSSTARRIFN